MAKLEPEDCKAALEVNIDESLNQAIDLQEVLDEERAALERRDTNSLNDTAVRKRMCICRMEELAEERAKISQSCGFEADTLSMSEMASWCDDSPATTESWMNFLDVAKQCSETNSANGAIIHVRRIQINNALALLRGDMANGDTYGPAGEGAGGLGQRALAT